MGSPSQSYGTSPAIWDHTKCYLPPDTGERARLNPSHRNRYSMYLPRRDGRLSWPKRLVKYTVWSVGPIIVPRYTGIINWWNLHVSYGFAVETLELLSPTYTYRDEPAITTTESNIPARSAFGYGIGPQRNAVSIVDIAFPRA